jgi:HPt (histidine-containing phosphotransfer) domain-containing protein
MSNVVSPAIAACTSDFDNGTFQTLLAELGREDTLQMFSVFFTEADKRLTRLREFSIENRKAIQHEAHGLKGSAGNFGLPRVSELAASLEQDAPTITPSRYQAALQSLEAGYATARERFLSLAR